MSPIHTTGTDCRRRQRRVTVAEEWMMPGKTKSSKPTVCAACNGTDLVRRITTYPVLLTGQLAGKQVNVGRVALHECQTCGHLMPTPAGQAKVVRNVNVSIKLFLGQLP